MYTPQFEVLNVVTVAFLGTREGFPGCMGNSSGRGIPRIPLYAGRKQ